MATISKEKILLKTGEQFLKVVKYSKNSFYCRLPDVLCEDLLYLHENDKSVYGKSQDEVDRLFTEKLKEWETATRKTTKVIFFRSQFHGALAKKEFKHRWENGYTPSYPEIGISNSDELWEFHASDLGSGFAGTMLGLTLQWAVYTKIEFKDKVDYKFVSGRYFDSWSWNNKELDSDITVIGHTEEREKFFLELDEAFARMIAKVYKALGDLTPEKLIKLSESKLKLLSS